MGGRSRKSTQSAARIADQVRGLNSDYQSSLQQGKAVPFIDLDLSSRQFVLSSTIRKMCKNQANPMATISIIGLKNSGKSFVLNHIMGIEKAFKVGRAAQHKKPMKSLINLIQVFSEPIQIERDGIVFDIYIVDSEGFEVEQAGVTDDFMAEWLNLQIMQMNVLLSSFLIFNAKEMNDFKILGDLLNKMEDLTTFDENLPQFPSLLWLKRDYDEGDEMELS